MEHYCIDIASFGRNTHLEVQSSLVQSKHVFPGCFNLSGVGSTVHQSKPT